MGEEDGVDFASVARVRYVMFFVVSCPGHVGQELSIELAELHGPDAAAPSIVDLLADLAVVPSVDDTASVGKEVEDICAQVLTL